MPNTDSKGHGKVSTNLTLRAAVGKSLDARSVAVEHGKGVLPAAAEEQKDNKDFSWGDDDISWLLETDSKGQGKVSTNLTLRAAVGKSLDARSVAVEHGKGVLPAAEEEQKDNKDFSWGDDDISWLLETDSKGQGKVSTNLTLPAAVGKSLDVHSVAVEHGKGVLPAAGEEQKEDNDSPWDSETDSDGPWDVSKNVLLPAAFGNRLDARAVLVRSGKGALPAAEEQKEDNDSPWDTKTDSKGQGKVSTNLTLRAAVGKSLDARSVAVEHGKGVLPAAGEEQKEDNDSPWDSETDSDGPWDVSKNVLLPAAFGNRLDARAVLVRSGKGALPAAEEQKEDNDSPWDTKTDSKGQGKVSTNLTLRAAVGKSLDARSVAVEHGKGVLPAAEEEQKDNKDFSWGDDDISWLLETDSKGQGKVLPNLTLPAAVGKSLDARSVAVEHGKGVLPAAGEEQKEDNDSPWDSETDSKGQGKVLPNLTLRAAVGKSLDARSVAVEHGKGVLPAAEEEQKDNKDFSWGDDDISWLLETDSKGQGKVSTNLTLPAAVGKSLDARSVAVEHGKGVLPAAGEEQKEDNDSPWDSETDSDGPWDVSKNVLLPAAFGNRLDARAVLVRSGKGALPAAEEQKEDNDSPWDTKTDSKGQGKVSADPTLPAAVGKSLDTRSVAVEHGKGALSAAEEQKEDSDSPWDSETDSDGPWDVSKNVLFPAAFGNRLDARAVLVRSGKGALPAAEEQKEDSDSPRDTKTDSKGQGKVSTNLTLPAAVGKSLDAHSVAVEHGKGFLPAAEDQKEDNEFSWGDDDFSWLLETDSKGQGKVLPNLTLPAAVGKSLDARSVAVEHGKGLLPAAGEEQKEDNDSPWDSETDSEGPAESVLLPAAVGKTLDARSVAVEHGKGALTAAEEQKEDNDSPWDSETDSKGQGKVLPNLTLRAAVGKSLDTRSVGVEHGKGVLPAAGEEQKEDSDSPWDSETDSEGPAESVLLPAAVGKSLDVRSVTVEHGKGVLPAAAEDQKEDNDFSWGDDDISWLLETDSKGQGKVSTNLTLPAAVGKTLDARSVAVEHGKGALTAAEEQKEDNDSPWDSETDSKGQGKVLPNLTLRAAVGKSLDTRSVGVEHGKGVLPAAGEEQKEDSDSPWDSETDSEGPAESVLLPAAVGKSLDVRSVTVEHGKGVLPAAAEDQKEDNDFSWGDDDISWLLETDSKGQGKVSPNLTLPAAVGKSLDARSVAVEHGKGVLPAAAEEQKDNKDFSWEDDDFFWLLETDSKGQGKASTNLTLRAAVGKSLDARSVGVEHGKGIVPAAGAEQKEYFDPSSKNKVPTLEAEDLQLRSDSSSQTDSQLDRQPLVRQLLEKPDEVLKKNSLAEPSLGAMKTHSKDLKEEKPLMQEKLERSEAKEPKEHHIQKECFAASLKSAPKEKEITTSRNLQGLPPSCNMSLPAAIGQLRERIHCLEVEYARLEATVQQQAQTIAIIEKFRQAQKTCKCSIIDRGARPKLP
ncbi:uncharacterized protein LOC114002941 [Pipra filicauda]|uniref:Uncharacterized protein LOC114002941 n=1 Tax=Pipra filicauda TaxID=649802 RepID=A0A7R5L704_9PASS|nr:uncharacterized protein LOC114002941 [Pipra filicauda]